MLAWLDDGAGPPLVLVNGYGGAAVDWDPAFVAALSGSFRVVRPDNRGMGDSPLADGEPLTVDTMAGDVLALLDHLGIARAVVVGWSMGGFVAQALARSAPERVTAMVLMSTDAGGPSAVPADPDVWARLTDRGGTPAERAERLVGLLFPPPVAAQVWEVAGDVVAASRGRIDDRALDAQEAAMRRWHALEQPAVPHGASPVLVMAGADDVVIPPGNAALVASRWHAGAPVIAAGGGHAFMAQDPDGVAATITEFVHGRG